MLLRDDSRVVRGAFPQAQGVQEPSKLDQGGKGDPRRADLHARAGHRIQHPRRHHGDHTGVDFDLGDVAAGPPLDTLKPDAPPEQRMMAIVDDDELPDMGRMTARWL
jgi:hypothetical protein